MNLINYLKRQIEWSERTFGHGVRTKGITAHIRKELEEVEADPHDLEEWVDVAILALDGAWRSGYSPQEIATALESKQAKNFKREFPMPISDDHPSEHVRPRAFNRAICLILAAAFLLLPCQRAKAPVPVFLGLALKCVGIGTIGATAVILYRCDQDVYLCRYRSDGEVTWWGASKASLKTLRKLDGERCQGPSKEWEEMKQRAWENNFDPDFPMHPCGPLGTPLPTATRTNYSIVSLQHSFNGGNLWRPAGDIVVDSNDPNWSICLLGPNGTNGMSRAELQQVMDCDKVVQNGLPDASAISDYAVRGIQIPLPPSIVKSKFGNHVSSGITTTK